MPKKRKFASIHPDPVPVDVDFVGNLIDFSGAPIDRLKEAGCRWNTLHEAERDLILSAVLRAREEYQAENDAFNTLRADLIKAQAEWLSVSSTEAKTSFWSTAFDYFAQFVVWLPYLVMLLVVLTAICAFFWVIGVAGCLVIFGTVLAVCLYFLCLDRVNEIKFRNR